MTKDLTAGQDYSPAGNELTGDISIRAMEKEDSPMVRLLFEKCFSHPWSLQSIEDMSNHSGYLNLLAWQGQRLIGYAGILAAADEADITNVATDPDYRRRSVAHHLLQELLGKAHKKGIGAIYLEVRKSNQPAIKLYEKAGFIQEGVRKNYYQDPREDAVIMKASLENREMIEHV